MKAYETLENIAGADPAEIAERCRISLGSAKAVRAAAGIAMEDRRAHQQKMATGKSKRTPAGKGTGEALAAEAAPEYK
jgi:hypothetical protein